MPLHNVAPMPWAASFISREHPAAAGDPALYFRRDFEVAEHLQSATLWVSALGIVEPFLNGVGVGDEVLAPGWTSYRHRLHVRGHDVTELVSTGRNTIGAIVGEGWAVGSLTWENRRHNYSDRPALFVQLELRYPDHAEVIGSDERFRIGHGAVRSNGIYSGEDYDARLEPEGWSAPGFDDTGWGAPTLFEWNLDALEATTIPPIRCVEEVLPVDIRRSPSGKTIVDFGQNLSGWVRLSVNGEAGQTVTLRHAELLTPGGEIEAETNRTAAATDRYTMAGGGKETWHPRFTFHGFRYVEIDGWPGKLDAADLSAVVVHSDMVRTGWFETSDELLTKLHTNTVWSMRGNFVGIPTDCPQRDERLGWTGDLNAFAPTAAYLYDVREVLGSWLRDLAAEQRASGNVPWVVPNVLTTPAAPTALWSDVAVSLPWLLYQEYGDPAILERSYGSMVSFIRQVEQALDPTGLWGSGFQFGDWLDPDAPPDNAAGGKTDRYLVASAYLCKTTQEMAATASVLGKHEDAAHFERLAKRVRAAFQREYVTAAGRVVNETATAYALAIMFGILDGDQRPVAGNRLAEIVEGARYKISTGFAGTPFVTDALSVTGHLEEAYALMLEKGCPSFLYPVTMGATTVWERWDAVLPDGSLNSTGMTSLNHYALGAVADWMHRVIGGLERVEPGWARLRIAPRPGGGLHHATAVHDTVRGRASVAWSIDDGEMVLEATVPAGSTATVVLPLHPEQLIEEVGSGTHSWRYRVPEGYGLPAELTMDTPLKELAKQGGIWSAVTEVLRTYFPSTPLDAGLGIPQVAAMSLNMVVRDHPEGGPGLARDLIAALDPVAVEKEGSGR